MSELTPVRSRVVLNPAVMARGMKPLGVLAESKPCGTRVRYYAGCRCAECKAANTAYERERVAARKAGDHRGLVDAAPVLAHINALRAKGLGWKTIADAACVASTVVYDVLYGRKTKVRAHTARKILAVTELARCDGARVDAAPSWALIELLVAWGEPRCRIASEMLGRPAKALQLSRDTITQRNAEKVRRVFERLKREPAEPTLKRLAELSEEGFNRKRVAQLLSAAAGLMGEPEPDLTVRDGTVLASAARVVKQVHWQLLDDAQLPEELT